MQSTAEQDLPHKDSRDIRLVVATPTELIAQQEANSIEWRGALSKGAYIRREELLYDQDLTRNGGLTPWILIHDPPQTASLTGSKNEPKSTEKSRQRKILCSCETINKLALVVINGKLQERIAHGVASVFCAPEMRGRGYAGRMMDEVNKVLRQWQMQDGQDSAMSILYSDIGKKFYAARGWQPFPSAHVSINVTEDKTIFSPEMSFPSTQLLGESDLARLCKRDEELLRRRIVKYHKPGRTSVAIVPDAKTIAWHHARERFVGMEILGKSPSTNGAMIGQVGNEDAWCYWTRVWTNPEEHEPNTLHVLRLVIEDDDSYEESLHSCEHDPDKPSSALLSTVALLAAARDAAASWGMKQVQIWNPTPVTVLAAQYIDPDSKRVDRDAESIASLLWYGEGSPGDIDWICNEKYAWC